MQLGTWLSHIFLEEARVKKKKKDTEKAKNVFESIAFDTSCFYRVTKVWRPEINSFLPRPNFLNVLSISFFDAKLKLSDKPETWFAERVKKTL